MCLMVGGWEAAVLYIAFFVKADQCYSPWRITGDLNLILLFLTAHKNNLLLTFVAILIKFEVN